MGFYDQPVSLRKNSRIYPIESDDLRPLVRPCTVIPGLRLVGLPVDRAARSEKKKLAFAFRKRPPRQIARGRDFQPTTFAFFSFHGKIVAFIGVSAAAFA